MRRFALGAGGLLLVAGVLAAFSTCGGGSGSGRGPTTPGVPVVTASPTPTPVPTPAPPLSASCARLGPGDPNATCGSGRETFLSDVEDAISTLQSQHPEIFAGDQIVNLGAYYVGLIKILDHQSLCAAFDGEELGVKSSNDFSDVFKLHTSRGLLRTGPRSYLGTCHPAVIPAAQGPLPPSPAGCPLPPSTYVACGKPAPQFFDDVSGAVNQLLTEQPQLFDFKDIQPGTDWPKIVDIKAYYQAIFAILEKKGYCVIFDGEEIEVKRTNDFTEHYKIDYSNAYVRTGKGIYRGACYPAAF